MKNLLAAFIVISLQSLPFVGYGQTLDEVLDKHDAAIGQEALVGMRSLLLQVREVNGFGGGKKYEVIKKHPNRIRIEGKWEGKTYIDAFDGTRAWTISPWTGVHSAQLMTTREREHLFLNLPMGSPLSRTTKTDRAFSLIGLKNIAGDKHHVVRCTFASGYFADFFIDAKTYLIFKRTTYFNDDVTQIESELYFKKYKKLGAFTLPFGYENRSSRNDSYDIIIDDIVIGYGAPQSLFNKPEVQETEK